MGDCSPARRFSGEVVQVVDGELAPVTIVSDGVVDGVPRTTANSNPWSLTTGASRGNGDARLETTAASVIIGELKMLQGKVGQWCYSTRPREGRRLGGSGGKGEAGPRRNRRCLAMAPVSSGDEIEQPGGVFCRGKREGKGERVLGFIGTVLMAS
jgi:hypothetical protein